jgi:methyl-accepting chemotaxis protein
MFRLNSIGAKLAIVAALILPILAWQIGKDTVASYQSYRNAGVLQSQNAAANNLIAGAYEILMERLAMNNALIAEGLADASALAEIEKRRSSAVQKIGGAYTALSAEDFPNKATLLSELKSVMDRANALRQRADAAMKQPKASRDGEMVKTLFSTMTELSATSQKVWIAVLNNTNAYDTELARLSNIKLLSWNLREVAGLERSDIGAAIAAKGQIPAEKLAAIAAVRAQMSLMWRLLQINLKADEYPAITKGIQLAKDGYFGGFQPLADQMRKISADGGTYPMTASQWVDTTTPQLFTLLETMYGAGIASEGYLDQSYASSLRKLAFELGLLAVVVGANVFAVFLVVFSIVRPLKSIAGAMQEMSGGNFSVVIPAINRNDEIGQIAQSAEQVVEKVGAMIAGMKVAAREVTGASGEIATATTDLSQRSEEQAASLEETSTSMEEMTATVKKNAENAQQAKQLAINTREVADRGGEVVAKTVEAMARIEESSRKISDIIIVIDEIARQTNLLALNAAVEAARAGEAGRGFAVVASEVRSLAQRSSQAAKDIKDLITNSTGQVKEGVELANRAGGALNEIVDSIQKVTQVVSDISNASVEQSTGIEQINKALVQMDQVMQQNSALVEENAATAKLLEEQARLMDERGSVFRLRSEAMDVEMRNSRSGRRAEAAAARSAAAPVRAAAPARPKAEPKAAPVRAAAGGGARRMQSQLATALKQEPEWKDF